ERPPRPEPKVLPVPPVGFGLVTFGLPPAGLPGQPVLPGQPPAEFGSRTTCAFASCCICLSSSCLFAASVREASPAFTIQPASFVFALRQLKPAARAICSLIVT